MDDYLAILSRNRITPLYKVGENDNCSKSSKSKVQNKKPILYKIFVKMTKYTNDPEWISFLDKASRGIFDGKKMKTDGENIIYIYSKNKIFKKSLFEHDKTRDNFEELKNFVSTYTGFCSQDEDQVVIPKEKIEMTWSKNVRSCKLKNIMLCRFASKKSEEFNFDKTTHQNLVRTLLTATFIDLIKANSIKLKDGSIHKISGLTFKENYFKLSYDNVIKKTKRREKSDATTTENPKVESYFIFPCSKSITLYTKKLKEFKKPK